MIGVTCFLDIKLSGKKQNDVSQAELGTHDTFFVIFLQLIRNDGTYLLRKTDRLDHGMKIGTKLD